MTPSTQRLYHQDSWRVSFEGTVLNHGLFNNQASVVLDQSAFYPESGGQLWDVGTLAGNSVINVQVDESGVVHHILEGALPAVGARVQGTVDLLRRRVHMAQHTGQHMLSRALLDVVHGETLSSRLGDHGCTIDLGVPNAADGLLQQAVDLVNAVVDEDRPIRAWFPTADELARLALRRAAKVTENIRVVEIEGFDASPCGGTHCTRTGQVGLVRITGVERYKGNLRVTFDAGKRARDSLCQEAAALRELAVKFTCGALEVPAGVDKLRRELTTARETLGLIRTRLAAVQAQELLVHAAGNPVVVGTLQDADAEHVRAVARQLTAHPHLAALLAGRTPEGLVLVFSRGEHSGFDCGAALKRVAQQGDGRGGGKPAHAEGRLPPTADFVALTAWTRSAAAVG